MFCIFYFIFFTFETKLIIGNLVILLLIFYIIKFNFYCLIKFCYIFDNWMRKSVQQTPKAKPPTPSQKHLQSADPKKFDPKDYQEYGLSKQQILQFKGAFEMFDAHGNGIVDISEMKEAFINLGFLNQSKFVLRLLDYVDKKNGGTIQFPQFIKIATMKIDQSSSKSEADMVFTGFDPTQSSKCTVYDLKDTVNDLGEAIDQQQIQNMFNKADFDEDNYVTQEDFYNVLTRKVYDNQAKQDGKTSQKALSTAGKRASRF